MANNFEYLGNVKGPRGLTGAQGVQGLPGVNAVANDTATAGYVDGPSATRTALDKTYARQGADSTQRTMALLRNETRDASILVIGDSTGNEESEWVFLLGQALAAAWPKWTVVYRLWNDTTTAYDPAVTLQTGTGARTLTIWNASVAGFTTSHWLAARAATAIYALTPDLIMLSMGHNEQNVPSDMWYSRYISLTESLAYGLPGADLMCIAQNPETANTLQQQRAEQYREIAARRGYGFVDVQQAFLDTGDVASYTAVDGIHPNSAGSQLWRDTVLAAFQYQKDGRRTAQPPTTLQQAGSNLLLNGNFAAFSSTVPDNWALAAGTAAVDTVNFESSTFNRVTGAGLVTSTAVKFTANSGAASSLYQYVPLSRVVGRWVTLAVRMFFPAGATGTVGRVSITDNIGSTTNVADTAPTAGFRWVIVSRFIPAAAGNCRALIIVDSSTGGGNCTIDRVVMVTGKYPYGS